MKTDPAVLLDWQERIARSDQQAFTELFRHFYDRLFHFCLQYVHVPEAAEEIVSDAFVRIWNRRRELQSIRNLEVYLFIAVKNLSLNYLEQYSSLRIVELSDHSSAVLVNTIDPERQLEWKEVMGKLDEVVSRLPDQCRRIFRLVKEEGFRAKEVPAILGISPRTVETQLARAMRRLHQSVGQYLDEKKGRSSQNSVPGQNKDSGANTGSNGDPHLLLLLLAAAGSLAFLMD